MEAIVYQGAGEFLRSAQCFLEEREAENNLMLGLCMRMANASEDVEPDPYFATVNDVGRIVAAAIMTPPREMIIYCPASDPEGALLFLARELVSHGVPVPGVLGESSSAAAFADIWSKVSGAAVTRVACHRIYQLREVVPPRARPGSFRVAAEDDQKLLSQWTLSFFLEALPNEPMPDVQKTTRNRIEQRELFVWEDGQAVSLAGVSRPTMRGSTVSVVYTPPEYRGRGYASACVAALSQHLLDSGYAYCTLFADADNPISNHVYKKIGYRPLCDYTKWRFAPTL